MLLVHGEKFLTIKKYYIILNKDIFIIGAIEVFGRDREAEIIDCLSKNNNITNYHLNN